MFLVYRKFKFLYTYSFETGIFCNIVHFFTVTFLSTMYPLWDHIPAKSIAVMYKKNNKRENNLKTQVKIYCTRFKNESNI